ncbi:membrane-spanning 4-domains subfamily A member 15-like [Tiliqua scincoides]|uniref:membrane-spanning 4-domains subfamily A member 15-like n=1 Tax=Tiliqua scincoides TaxID=71010 RepID=UPI0034618558
MDPERAKELPQSVKKFYKGEPLALGVTQILLGVLTIMFGVVLNVGYYYGYHFPYVILMTPHWTGALYIISGSLSVAAARNPKPPLVKGMLGMNVVSTVAAGYHTWDYGGLSALQHSGVLHQHLCFCLWVQGCLQ